MRTLLAGAWGAIYIRYFLPKLSPDAGGWEVASNIIDITLGHLIPWGFCAVMCLMQDIKEIMK